jgi:hypothetical protein
MKNIIRIVYFFRQKCPLCAYSTNLRFVIYCFKLIRGALSALSRYFMVKATLPKGIFTGSRKNGKKVQLHKRNKQ